MKSALEVLAELKDHIDRTYRGEDFGFVITVFESYGTGSRSATCKTVSDRAVRSLCEKLLSTMEGERIELPRPERMHSDRCRASIRSSKDSRDAD